MWYECSYIHFLRQHWIHLCCYHALSISSKASKIVVILLAVLQQHFLHLVIIGHHLYLSKFLSWTSIDDNFFFDDANNLCFASNMGSFLFGAVLNVAFALSLLGFLIMHASLVSSNTTTIEVSDLVSILFILIFLEFKLFLYLSFPGLWEKENNQMEIWHGSKEKFWAGRTSFCTC